MIKAITNVPTVGSINVSWNTESVSLLFAETDPDGGAETYELSPHQAWQLVQQLRVCLKHYGEYLAELASAKLD